MRMCTTLYKALVYIGKRRCNKLLKKILLKNSNIYIYMFVDLKVNNAFTLEIKYN